MAVPLGLIVNADLTAHPPFDAAQRRHVSTPYGGVTLWTGDGWVLLNRHGPSGAVPPHRINHRAHIEALRQCGVWGVVAFCSVGGLRPDLAHGPWVVPEDFLSLAPAVTFYDEQARHVTPELSRELQAAIVRCLADLGLPYVAGGVYVQMPGPRLETRAEVRMIATFGDVVGMTFASEATLCIEAGLAVAAACHVHNLAHGVAGSVPVDTAIVAQKRYDTQTVAALAAALVKESQKR